MSQEVAKELKVSIHTVRAWGFQKCFPVVKLGRRVLVYVRPWSGLSGVASAKDGKGRAIDRHDYSYFLNGFDPGSDGLAKMALNRCNRRIPAIRRDLGTGANPLFGGKGDLLKERLGFASFDGQDILRTARLVEIPAFGPDGTIRSWSFRLYPAIDGRRYLHAKGEPARPYILPERGGSAKAA